MAYKNWERNYHAERKANNWKRNGYGSWWDFEKDWKRVITGSFPYWRRPYMDESEKTFGDFAWKVAAYHPYLDRPIADLTLEEVTELDTFYGRIERKKCISGGAYRHGRTHYFKHVYNRRLRRTEKKYCQMVVEDRMDEADYWLNLNQQHFGYEVF